MKKELAESFSQSFHPILIPFYSLLFIFVLPIFEVSSLGFDFQLFIIIVIAITTILLPIISLIFLKRQNIVSSFLIENRKERSTPYIMMFIYYIITTIMLLRVEFMPYIISLVVAIAAAGTLVLFLINLRIKISVHAMGMGSLGGLLYLLMHFYELNLMTPIVVTLLLSVIVIVSRYYLKAHTAIELIMGYLAGIFISIGMGFYFLSPLFV